MPDRPELDDHIRQLVARAADDAPPAPDLDDAALVIQPADDRSASRWLIGGISGLSIAAALVAIFLFTRTDEMADPLVPATPPPATIAAPDTTLAGTLGTLAPIPDTTPASQTTIAGALPTFPSIPDRPPVESNPLADSPTTTAAEAQASSAPTTAAPAEASERVAVAAGPDGVTITSPAGDSTVVTAEPMRVAVVASDGRVFAQRSDDLRTPEADTTILLVDPPSVAPVAAPGFGVFDGPFRLHDVVDVDGEVVLLVETGPEQCNGFEGCDGVLWAVRPDSSNAAELDRMSVWEAGWSRLHVANNGVAVGTLSAEVASSLYSLSLTDAPPVDRVAVGLDEAYFDCSDCPASFSIDPSGRYVVWTQYDVETFQHTVHVVAVDGSDEWTVPLVDADGVACCGDGDLPFFASLEVAELSVDGDGISGTIIVNDLDSFRGAPRPVAIDLGTGRVVPGVPGVTISFGRVAIGF